MLLFKRIRINQLQRDLRSPRRPQALRRVCFLRSKHRGALAMNMFGKLE